MFLRSFASAVLLSGLFLQPAFAAKAPDSFATLVETLSPAVVNISTTQKIIQGNNALFPLEGLPPEQREQFRQFFQQFGGMPMNEGAEQEVQSLGSGFVIDPAGYVVTNNHVIDKAEQITVRFPDNTQMEAKIVGRDVKTDLALLKVNSKKPLAYVTFGDSEKSRVGDWVLAIGNPFGLGGTVTAGIISARARNINAGPFDDFLQTDAAINRGNSGGPMFDMDGHVIGINTAIFSPSGGSIGIGFAIPSSLAQPVLKQLRDTGRIHRGWLGVKIGEVTEEIADSVGLKDAKNAASTQGALVVEATKDSPAAKAGLRAGDVILEFDGKPVKEMHFLPRLVAETKIGKNVVIGFWRAGEHKTVNITVAEAEEAAEDSSDLEDSSKKPEKERGDKFMGLRLLPLDNVIRKRMKLDKSQKGVVITQVIRDSEASKRGLRPLDVVIAVNQVPVGSLAEVKSAWKLAEKSGRKYVLLHILRGQELAFVPLPLEESAN